MTNTLTNIHRNTHPTGKMYHDQHDRFRPALISARAVLKSALCVTMNLDQRSYLGEGGGEGGG